MIFMISDIHFGHSRVIQYSNRPFRDVEHMNEELVRLWNETVTDQDVVFFLGDFSMNSKKYVPLYGTRLHGIKYIVPVNHDNIFDISRKTPDKQEALRKPWIYAGFSILPEYYTFDETFDMCHFPYLSIEENQGYELKYVDKRPIPNGKWLLHGHTHSPIKIDPIKKCVNLSVEAWNYRPASLDEILQLIKE